jgi:hypothetical protein
MSLYYRFFLSLMIISSAYDGIPIPIIEIVKWWVLTPDDHSREGYAHGQIVMESLIALDLKVLK